MSEILNLGPDAASLYRDLVVERARRPLHGGRIDPADAVGQGTNPLCGDQVQVTLRLDPERSATEIRHHTRGCTICVAAADLMAESVQGCGQAEAEAMFSRFEQLLNQGEAALELADRERLGLLLAFTDLHDYRSRRKCATLPWSALLGAYRSGGTEGQA